MGQRAVRSLRTEGDWKYSCYRSRSGVLDCVSEASAGCQTKHCQHRKKLPDPWQSSAPAGPLSLTDLLLFWTVLLMKGHLRIAYIYADALVIVLLRRDAVSTVYKHALISRQLCCVVSAQQRGKREAMTLIPSVPVTMLFIQYCNNK